MGLTIHYKGTIKDISLIDTLCYEVLDIADGLGWFWDKISGPGFEGVMFAPEGSERVQLHFDRSGKLVAGDAILHGLKSPEYIFCKTQYAGLEGHMAVIKLLRYLKDKYFAEFRLVDDGGYWESGDETVLRKQFAAFEAAMDKMSGMLAGAEKVEGESAEGLVDRLEKLLSER